MSTLPNDSSPGDSTNSGGSNGPNGSNSLGSPPTSIFCMALTSKNNFWCNKSLQATNSGEESSMFNIFLEGRSVTQSRTCASK